MLLMTDPGNLAPGTLVSIGIATFNAFETVERAVRSALSQTWRPIEVIVVDDCSTDATWAHLQRLASIHSELRLFANTLNGGVAVTRNRIIAEARGSFLAFFDDDDESDSHRIEKQLNRILAYERDYAGGALVMCHSARMLIYPDGGRHLAPTMGQTLGRAAPAGIGVARRVLLGTPLEDGYGACPTCSQMSRLETYRTLGGFDPMLRRSEDTDLNIRVALAGGHFVGLAEPLVSQFMTKTSEKSLFEEYKNARILLEKHRGFMESEGQFEFCVEWLMAKRLWQEGFHRAFLFAALCLAFRWPLLTFRRLWPAVQNISINLAFGRFHRGPSATQ
jgi:GT2 family glycosyltransferase